MGPKSDRQRSTGIAGPGKVKANTIIQNDHPDNKSKSVDKKPGKRPHKTQGDTDIQARYPRIKNMAINSIITAKE